MNFDWMLFIGISVIGPYFGGMICAYLEKGLTGEVRHDIKSKKKRSATVLISIALSYIATKQIASLVTPSHLQQFYILMRVLTIATGVAVFLFLQSTIYAMLIRKP